MLLTEVTENLLQPYSKPMLAIVFHKVSEYTEGLTAYSLILVGAESSTGQQHTCGSWVLNIKNLLDSTSLINFTIINSLY